MKKLGENKVKWFGLILAAALLVTAFQAGKAFGAGGAEPGSSGDPLITQSYLESRLNGVAGGYRKVSLKKGRVAVAEPGTQIILYSGSAVVSGAGEILNLSEGAMFAPGDTVSKYQIYLVPESGRGIKATGDCILFIQGECE